MMANKRETIMASAYPYSRVAISLIVRSLTGNTRKHQEAQQVEYGLGYHEHIDALDLVVRGSRVQLHYEIVHHRYLTRRWECISFERGDVPHSPGAVIWHLFQMRCSGAMVHHRRHPYGVVTNPTTIDADHGIALTHRASQRLEYRISMTERVLHLSDHEYVVLTPRGNHRVTPLTGV